LLAAGAADLVLLGIHALSFTHVMPHTQNF
jgi:hypothetical protein